MNIVKMITYGYLCILNFPAQSNNSYHYLIVTRRKDVGKDKSGVLALTAGKAQKGLLAGRATYVVGLGIELLRWGNSHQNGNEVSVQQNSWIFYSALDLVLYTRELRQNSNWYNYISHWFKCFKLFEIRSCIVFYISEPCIIVKLTALLFISSAVSCNWWQDLMIWWKIISEVQLKIKRKCVGIYSLCPTDDQHHLWCKFYAELNFLTRLISHKSAIHVPFLLHYSMKMVDID